jgi:hypothetical protein
MKPCLPEPKLEALNREHLLAVIHTYIALDQHVIASAIWRVESNRASEWRQEAGRKCRLASERARMAKQSGVTTRIVRARQQLQEAKKELGAAQDYADQVEEYYHRYLEEEPDLTNVTKKE